jgi:SSS family solute:Na+ symporter
LSNFSGIDWGIVAVYLALIFAAGVLVKRYVGNLSDFLVAGRGMGQNLGIVSLMSAEIGILTYVYYAEMGFIFGFSSFLPGLIPVICLVVIGLTGFCIRRLRDLKLMTIPEYFQRRYSRGVRVLAGILMATGGALNLGVFPRLEAAFLNIVTGVPQEYLIWTMAILLLVVLVYTAMGGMVSILITNYIQYVLLSVGMLIITAVCFLNIGLGDMIGIVTDRIGRTGFDPISHPDMGWTFIAWQILLWVGVLTCWQSIAMRTFSSKDSRVGMRIFTRTGVLFLGRALLPMFWGIAALAYFGKADIPIEAMPAMLNRLLPVGIIGLVIAAMLAASMSTYASYLLAWGSIISQDILQPIIRRPLGDAAKVRLNRITVVLLTLFIMFWGLLYKIPGPTYFYLNMTANLFLAGTLASIVAGLYWKRANFGALSVLGYFFGGMSPKILGFLSFGLAFVGMIAGSLVGGLFLKREGEAT